MGYEKIKGEIWSNMYRSSGNKWQCLIYRDKCKIRAIVYDVLIITFPFISALLIGISQVIPAIIVTTIVGVMEILKHLTNYFVKSKEQLDKMAELAEYYSQLFGKFKNLWREMQCRDQIDENMFKEFCCLSCELNLKEVELNGLTPHISKSTNFKINKKATLDILGFVGEEKKGELKKKYKI